MDMQLLALYAQKHHPYRCSVWQNVAQSITNTTIHFDTIAKDPNNNYSLSTFSYTVPVTGFYWAYARYILSGTGVNTFFSIQLNYNDFNNNAQVLIGEGFPAAINAVGISPCAFVSGIIPCVAGSTILAQTNYGGAATNTATGQNFTFMHIQLMSLK